MEKRKVALITGITGQDGSYLAELLLSKGYDVHGTIRRSSTDYRERIAHLEGTPNFHLHYADLGDSMSIIQVMNKVKPTEREHSVPPLFSIRCCQAVWFLDCQGIS